jgi:predicted O-methyltransferase YrrM
MPKKWTAEELTELTRAYQPACVLMAAAEVDLFSAVATRPMAADELAIALRADQRATRTLGDALAALGLLDKRAGVYTLAPGLLETLTEGGSASLLPMLRHQASCMRSWAQLAAVVTTGRAAERIAGIHGADADRDAFIEAMEVASRQAAPRLVASLAPLSFRHLLDIGGGPGTYTIAFLRAVPGARATLYDLPEVVSLARRHIEAAGLADRVELAGGSFAVDEALPAGADLAWVSAIVHMNSRRENRRLFAKIHTALAPGGQIMIRDIVMDDARISPRDGALFAVNMLVRTESGGTYTFTELREDLEQSGFANAVLLKGERDMDSIIRASKI